MVLFPSMISVTRANAKKLVVLISFSIFNLHSFQNHHLDFIPGGLHRQLCVDFEIKFSLFWLELEPCEPGKVKSVMLWAFLGILTHANMPKMTSSTSSNDYSRCPKAFFSRTISWISSINISVDIYLSEQLLEDSSC